MVSWATGTGVAAVSFDCDTRSSTPAEKRAERRIMIIFIYVQVIAGLRPGVISLIHLSVIINFK